MNTTYGIAASFALCLLVTTAVAAQEATDEGATGKADNVIAETQAKVDDIAEQIDESEKAKEITAGLAFRPNINRRTITGSCHWSDSKTMRKWSATGPNNVSPMFATTS